GDHEELLGAAERHQLAARAHGADVEGGDMTRQLAERVVRPEHCLRAVSHVVVPERPRPHGVEHDAARFAIELVIDPQRNAIAITLVALPAAAQRGYAHGAHGTAV